MKTRILIIEDEPSIAELIAINLIHSDFVVDRAVDTEVAMHMIQANKPDLIILDWLMPGKSGIEFIKELRANPLFIKLPILMLTAKGAEEEKIQGLDSGADDYVTKPFSPKELIARIKALLRRNLPSGYDKKTLKIGPIELDPSAHRVSISRPGEQEQFVNLGPTEFQLLKFFMNNPERVHTRAMILAKVWGDEVYIEERTVDVHIKRLRAALAKVGCSQFIETIRSAGYRITKNPN